MCIGSGCVDLLAEEAGEGVLGDTCQESSDCTSTLCAQLTNSNSLFCTEDCSGTGVCSDPNFMCSISGANGLCIPIDNNVIDTLGGTEAGVMNTGMNAGTNNNAGTMAGDMAGTNTDGGTNAGTMTAGDDSGTDTNPNAGTDTDPAGNEAGTIVDTDVNLDCIGIFECLEQNQCQDQSCFNNCFNQATAQGQQSFSELQECFTNSGCDSTDQDCLLNSCSNEVNLCEGGGNPGPIPSGLSCLEIFECLQTNQCQDQACAEQCVNQASAEGGQSFNQLQQCFANSGCNSTDQDCLLNSCPNEVNECQNGGGSPTPMGLSCAETLFCAGNCQQDQSCINACLNSVNNNDRDSLNNYVNCLQTNECQDQSCIDQNCGNEYTACIPPGNAGCDQTLNCLTSCQDDYCQFNCQIEADQQALTLFNDLANCYTNNQCVSLDVCNECQGEINACQND